jgi:hypothetical protein
MPQVGLRHHLPLIGAHRWPIRISRSFNMHAKCFSAGDKGKDLGFLLQCTCGINQQNSTVAVSPLTATLPLSRLRPSPERTVESA